MAAPVYISFQMINANGLSVTVPSDCTMVVGVGIGNPTASAITLGGISMTRDVYTNTQDCLYHLADPPLGVRAIVMTTVDTVYFMYFKNMGQPATAALSGSAGNGAWLPTIASTNSDMLIGFSGGGGTTKSFGLSAGGVGLTLIRGTSGGGTSLVGYMPSQWGPTVTWSVRNNGSGGSTVGLVASFPYKASGPAKLKTWNGLDVTKLKTFNGLARDKIKTINSLP